MSNTNELAVILNEVIQRYIREYFNIYVPREDFKESEASLITTDIVKEVIPTKQNMEVYAIDGSSRSIFSAGGTISISTVAVSSSNKPVYGVYPGLFGLKGLEIQKPFIALAPSSNSKGTINPYLYSSKYIMTFSLDGTPFQSTIEPERIEIELRAILETEALKVLKNKGLVLVDGPLFPPYIYLPERVKTKITNERLSILDQNFIGVVKRIDKSDLLIRTLSNNKELTAKYKVDPRGFLSDEAYLYQFVRFNYNPPYPTLSIGPLVKDINERVKVFVNYMIYPIHKYVPKFSILRIESIGKNALDKLSSLKFTTEGIPLTLAVADKTAKELSSGILRFIMFSLDRIGVQESFRNKFEVLDVV
ncbi:hypothetical protein SUSAZ_00745 [Sulfolobus acidocaldarius SUSAZ]|nr:hypothetical protein SUSAZ_00745 [Sulfolobus acidocaldarius SUSAZ]